MNGIRQVSRRCKALSEHWFEAHTANPSNEGTERTRAQNQSRGLTSFLWLGAAEGPGR